ncbi:hypothetical protein M2118_001177 [Aurantimicrobium minutum]|uniref:TIR domain-containing protein n=1 Tax=Aurantimicrobium minutum TaxID=708131 RepID=UPI0024731776|nr:TIR domain-containing protein [Aurantimicrobium minutum]MDH6278204.1 hypothetical protein [Aurantimicrobium minutum]
MAEKVFFSFHYERDVHRVQMVRNINAIHGEPSVEPQKWEEVKKGGDAAIENWVATQMKGKSACIVLLGTQTCNRLWVQYEINHAWKTGTPLLAIRIHGLPSMSKGPDNPGPSPFKPEFQIPVFDPTVKDLFGNIDPSRTYNNLARNIETWSKSGRIR